MGVYKQVRDSATWFIQVNKMSKLTIESMKYESFAKPFKTFAYFLSIHKATEYPNRVV